LPVILREWIELLLVLRFRYLELVRVLYLKLLVILRHYRMLLMNVHHLELI